MEMNKTGTVFQELKFENGVQAYLYFNIIAMLITLIILEFLLST